MFTSLLKKLSLPIIYAHCDIPCGIYDPHQAQLAAHTVIRMTQLITDLKKEGDDAEEDKHFVHALSRYVKVKDDHAEILKHEVSVIWGDYFKEEQLKEYPNLHALVFSIMKLASKARQEVNLAQAQALLAKTQEFAEMFWKSKGRKTIRVASGFPTGGEMVLPT